MAWLYLLIAGLLEIVWATALKFSDGFSRILPTVVALTTAWASFWFLSLAIRKIPIGTAYAVPIGIFRIASDRNQKLAHAVTSAVNVGSRREKPSENFNAVAHTISSKPAISR